VARWRESGLTAKEFAAETGVNAHTLTHWAWQLGGRAKPAPRLAARRPARPKWIEVIGDRTSHAGADATARGFAGFELVLAGGRTVRVPADFNDEALGRLLAVVDER
jgi:hypothetical protein